MVIDKIVLILCCALLLGLSGCSRQQSDWQKTRETNTAEAYEQFLKKYPSGEFTAQAQARVKELYEERDWQKARDADTAEAYQAFLKEHPEGKWTEEARIRVENFTLAQTPSASGGAPGSSAAPSGTGTGTAPAGSGAAANPQASAPGTKPPTTAPAKAAGPSAPASKSSSGSYAVQLGAFKSGAAAANRRWARLQKQYPTLLAGLSPKVLPKKTATGTLYRLQAVGVSERHARNICKTLRAKSQACTVVRPAHA
ncbi:MAG: SPOR domain-containing protein [Steroidobacteraceae bacterium]